MDRVIDDGEPAVTASSEVSVMLMMKEWSDSTAMSSIIVTLRDCTVGIKEGGNVTDIPSANAKSFPSAVRREIQNHSELYFFTQLRGNYYTLY